MHGFTRTALFVAALATAGIPIVSVVAASPTAPAIPYTADGRPNLSAPKGMTYDQLHRFLSERNIHVNANSGLDDEVTTANFAVPLTPKEAAADATQHIVAIPFLCIASFSSTTHTIARAECSGG